MPEHVQTEIADGIGILIVNRPDALNALDGPTLRHLDTAFDQLNRDKDIRVIVLAGAGGKAFVAGGDIRDLNSRQGLAHYQELAEDLHGCFSRIEASDKPTIAAIDGWALGGGVELLLCTDMRIAGASATFGLPEINLGLFPGAGGTQRLIREIAPCRARELMFTGNRIDADEALALGLVNSVVDAGSALDAAKALAATVASKSPLVLKLMKRTLRHGLSMPLPAALAHEQAMIGLVLDSDDAHEGCGAFIEKRQPEFQGR